MIVRRINVRALLLAAGTAALLPLAAAAQPVPDYHGGFLADATPVAGQGATMPPPAWGDDGPRHRHRFDGPGAGGPMPPMLRGLSLTETQRDQIFAIVHAQEPALREKAKTAHRAQDDLRALAMSTEYDNAKAAALVETSTRAFGELALLRADTDHQIYLVLTDEQRQQLAAMPQGRRRN